MAIDVGGHSDEGFTGVVFMFITASDSYGQAVSNMFKIEVNDLGIEILESAVVEETWTVSFSTKGTENLTITAIEGSYVELYNDNVSTIDNLDILGLKCGEFEIFDKENLIETEGLWFVLMNNSRVDLTDLVQESLPIKSVYVEDYNCNDAGYYTIRVLGEGVNTQEFKFGDEIKIVSVGYVERVAYETFEIRDKEDNKLIVIDSFGNMDIKGVLTQNVLMEKGENDFIIRDFSGVMNFLVTNPEGNVYIRGFLNENQDELIPTPNSFIIQNKDRNNVAYVNGTGSLFLKGVLTENVVFE